MLKKLALVLLFFSCFSAAGGHKADKMADAWLAIVDQGEYSVSWKTSDVFFQQQITEQDWLKALAKTRTPLGDKVQRQLIDRQTHADLPSAPSGDYLIIIYRTDFETKTQARETLILRDNHGKWGVVGYFIE